MKKIAWGIVGAGRIAASFVEALAQSKDSELGVSWTWGKNRVSTLESEFF